VVSVIVYHRPDIRRHDYRPEIMTIATFADVKSGLLPPLLSQRAFFSNSANASGHLKTAWAQTPSIGVYNGTLNGVTLSGPMLGALSQNDAAAGLKQYIARLSLTSPQASTTTSWLALLCDRLWHNGGINATSTSLQSITSPPWPARDINGSTDGEGVFLGVEFSGAHTIGSAPVITVGYTNSAGVAGRSATNSLHAFVAHSASAVTPLDLQAGDTGVRSVQSITINPAFTTAALNLVAYRPIVLMPVIGGAGVIDALTGCLPNIPDGAVLFFWEATGSSNADGSLGSFMIRLDLTAG
jgi:hypothetical protein